MFLTEEDKKASEELFKNFPAFGIRVGIDRHDFMEGRLYQRQWKIEAPDKNKIWRTGGDVTFVGAYNNLLKRISEMS